jgi:hypothetical protein
MAILGLIGTEALSANRFKNVRRSVFYDYPNGAAPLTGLTSLMEEESTNDPEFNWWEKRLKEQRTTTASQGSSKGPFLDATGADGGDPFATIAGTEYQVKVASTTQFRVGHVIRIPVTAGAASKVIVGIVTAVVSTTVLKFRAIEAVTAVDNGVTNENVGAEVLVIGSAHEQGQVGSSNNVYNVPVNPANFCQIFRTSVTITGTALKTSLKYDETGAYKDQAKEAAINHMREMEFAFIFGRQSKTVVDPSGLNLPTYTTGGLLWNIEQWEAGTLYEVTASTLDTDDNKRIITNSSGRISEKDYDNYLERLFRVTNNKANEKLCLCGSGFLNTINRMYKSKSVLNADLPLTATYGMKVVSHVSPFGTVYYKTHPLFTMNSALRFNGLFIDVGNLRYRYVDGRDTELLTNRQPNDADYRKDEWLTECGLETRYPESNLYLQNLLDYTP